MGSQYETSLRRLVRYCGITFGAGYILVYVGLIAILAEAYVRTLPYSGGFVPLSNVPPLIVFAAISLFIAVLCGIGLGVLIVRNSNWRARARRGRHSDQMTKRISPCVLAFSLMILFLGIGVIAAISTLFSYSSGYSSYPFGPSSAMLTPISLVIGAALLLIGYRVFLKEQVESKLVGGILMIVSIVLTYIVALSPLRNLWNLLGVMGSIASVRPPPLPGFLACEVNLETASLLVVAVCAVLYAFPSLRGGNGLHVLRILLSISAIVFGVGLLIFNFSMVSIVSTFISFAPQFLASIWLVFVGLIILGISGILIIVSASLSLGLSLKEIQATIQTPPPPPPPPPLT